MKARLFLVQCVITVLLVNVFAVAGSSVAVHAANPLSGDYYGSVAVSSPAGLGNLDLAFHLVLYANGNIALADSYILLDKTILFPKVAPQVGGKDVGPRVKSGYIDPPNNRFFLRTQPFPSTLFPGTASEREVTRQITLKNPIFSQDGISGTYVETIAGYLPKTITVVGRFVLAKPQ